MLFAPIVLACDTRSGIYQMYQKITFFTTIKQGEKIQAQVRLFGIRLNSGKNKKPKPRRKGKKRKKGWSPNQPLKLMQRSLKSLTVKNLTIAIDTGDVVLNAELTPIAFMLTNKSRNRLIEINFEGHLLMVLNAEIRLYIILIAVIKDLLKR